eukprot:8771006-Pyramimonas_sp.AAC.1
MTAQDGPKTHPESFQIVTRSFRETSVGSSVARGSPQWPLEGTQESSRMPQQALTNLRETYKRLS